MKNIVRFSNFFHFLCNISCAGHTTSARMCMYLCMCAWEQRTGVGTAYRCGNAQTHLCVPTDRSCSPFQEKEKKNS